MKKMVYIDAQEIERYQNTINNLREENDLTRIEKKKLLDEIKFLKDSGDEILVIEKNGVNDIYEYKSTEKELLTSLVHENQELRDRYDSLLRERDNLENQKQIVIMKYHEMENSYKNTITTLRNNIKIMNERGVFSRLFNSMKNIDIDVIRDDKDDNIDASEPIKTIYTKSEIKRLEAEAKMIEKPRGWHFKKEFIDSEGNVYHKGKLQPHLKKHEN